MLSTRPFSFSVQALKSLGIRTVTRSKWSHAAIISTSKHIIEAVGEGVVRLSIAGTLIEPGQNVRVLRLKPEYGGPRVAQSAAELAERRVSHEYASIRALAHSVLAIRWLTQPPNEHEHFCSHLVAQSYEPLEVSIVPGKSSVRITPSHFGKSVVFFDITDQVIDEASSQMVALPIPTLGDTPSEVPEEGLLERAVVKQALAAVQDHEISPRPTTLAELVEAIVTGVISEPTAAKAFDSALLAALESVKWREMHERIERDTSVRDLCHEVRGRTTEGVIDNRMRASLLALLKQHEHSKSQANERRRENCLYCAEVSSRGDLRSVKYLAEDFFSLWKGAESVLADLRATIALLESSTS